MSENEQSGTLHLLLTLSLCSLHPLSLWVRHLKQATPSVELNKVTTDGWEMVQSYTHMYDAAKVPDRFRDFRDKLILSFCLASYSRNVSKTRDAVFVFAVSSNFPESRAVFYPPPLTGAQITSAHSWADLVSVNGCGSKESRSTPKKMT